MALPWDKPAPIVHRASLPWSRPRDYRVRGMRRHVGGAQRVGQIFWTPDEVRALIRRVNARYHAMHGDVSRAVLAQTIEANGGLAEAWQSAYNAWETFMRDTCVPSRDGRDVCAEVSGGMFAQMGWGGTVTQVQNYDRELDAWRTRFREETGVEASNPTGSTTGDAPTPGSEWRWPIIAVAVAVTAAAGAYVYVNSKAVIP